jgi:hypothetical protein
VEGEGATWVSNKQQAVRVLHLATVARARELGPQ